MRAGEVARARNVNYRRRLENDVAERLRKIGGVEQSFEIKTAARLKIRLVTLATPVRGRDKTSEAVAPLATRHVAHFVIPALEQTSLERRFRACVFEIGQIAAKLYLQRWRARWKTEFL